MPLTKITRGALDINIINQEKIDDDAVGAAELASDAVVNASVDSGAAIDATKIADGTVTSAEFQYINTLSSNAQTQISAALPKAGGTMSGNIAMGSNDISGVGEVEATSLDISGDADIDGTLETDNLTVGGSQGSDGEVLTSTGSGVAWEAAGGGSGVSGVTSDGTDITITSGDLIMGTAGKGIDFSANTADHAGLQSEVLDDYEEGQYDIVVTSAAGSTTLHSDLNEARYVKIGRLVFVTGMVEIGTSTASGWLGFNLPFSGNEVPGEENSHLSVGVLAGDNAGWSTSGSPYVETRGSTVMYLRYQIPEGARADYVIDGDEAGVYFSVVYNTAT
jgi:hypothetical protein